ncbi:hypothetical protein [Solilutibacter silvestris]|uniref:Uncharacterized protein n=1 Tax=Solilutibacter silvestris TaxID=1645665 RepID=A0A2K1Q243_9GAMM|nr:hypothetical protein [Lysobacter silvestris]PNS09099.1 hypothetical protein Lysil_0728 [Lysobacter silvestris]
MKAFLRIIPIVHALMASLFALSALSLIFIAVKIGVSTFSGDMGRSAAQNIVEAMGVLASAVVALQIAQTIAEEEVVRDAHVSGPTRVRRYLSRFMVVVIVALAVEGLVATFRAADNNSGQLFHAAAMILAVGALLAGWGFFIRMNCYAEELEPEAMEEAKREDVKLGQGGKRAS